MRISLLPKRVELTLDEHHEWTDEGEERVRGELIAGSPVFVCEPVGMLAAADYSGELSRTRNSGVYAHVFAERVREIKDFDIDGDAFDPKRRDHIDALDPLWGVELGRKLLAMTRLTGQERGKSS